MIEIKEWVKEWNNYLWNDLKRMYEILRRINEWLIEIK